MTDEARFSERRIITVLAVDIVDSTRHIVACDPDDAQAFYDRCFEQVRKAVVRAGGTLVSYSGDGGIATFGWPKTLERHADGACVAAWEIRGFSGRAAGPDGEAVAYRVGVHSGLVALRRIRRGGRPRLDTVGATVNIAAKLQQSAGAGTVVLSRQAVRLCLSSLNLTPHRDLPRFIATKTEAFRLESRPEQGDDSDLANRYRSPIVGRHVQIAVLNNLLPREGGESSSVALVGEAGIGKSRLAAALVADAHAGGTRVIAFFGDAQKRTTPFAAARSLIEGLLSAAGGSSRKKGIKAVLARVRLKAPEVAAIEALLRSRPAERKGGSGVSQLLLARALVDAFCALACDAPKVVLIEDFHLVDPESQQFLRVLAQANPRHPLCIMLTCRPEALREACTVAQMLIQLEPLSRFAME
ncbi:MAG TPA: AAA family ATPase, partial [Caulobacteraceae bacterium]|nr:AAA family ATPase [Caulobacteraceae bacterium]